MIENNSLTLREMDNLKHYSQMENPHTEIMFLNL